MSLEISIHVPREGDDLPVSWWMPEYTEISIHVPREGDDDGIRGAVEAMEISIHVPREGDDT